MKKIVAISAIAFTLSSIAAPLTVDAANYKVYTYSNNGSCTNIQDQLKNYTAGGSCTPGKIVMSNGNCLNLEDYGIKFGDYNSNCNNNNQDCTPSSNCPTTDAGTSTPCPGTQVTPEPTETETPATETPASETPATETETTTPDTENVTPEKPATPVKPVTPAKPETPSADAGETKDLTYAEQVVELVNAERAKEGLSPLTIDKTLGSAALVRAKEIQSTFAHTRPNGSSFATAITEAGGSYRGAGENIAYGQKSPKAVVTAWMNSAGHRANIMNKSYTKIGVGYLTNSNVPYWVQLFSY